MTRPTVSLYLDTRRAKADGTFPVKICIYHKADSKAKYYPTSISLTEAEYKEVCKKSPKPIYEAIVNELKKQIDKAEEEVKMVQPFTFEAYNELRERAKMEERIEGSRHDVFFHYEQRINYFRKVSKSIGTARSFECSQNSIKAFLAYRRLSPKNLLMERITREWLEEYEGFMQESGKSRTTIAMYLRALRVVLNAAIEVEALDPRHYPFGKKKYKIKEGSKVKKALTREELKALYTSQPTNPEQQKAKDFWFFSYLCNGMNVKDIINLRYGQIGKESFVFERIKTRNTNRQSQPIQIFLNDHIRYVIQEYGNPASGRPSQLVFPFLSDRNTPEQNYNITQAFTRFINQHIKKLALANGITGEISTYFARHSYATGLIRNGKPIAFVQEALGHASSTTTGRYIAGFPNDEKKETSETMYQDLKS